MRSLFNAALAVLLCAGSAAALGKGQTASHTHDSVARGGSTLRPAVLTMSPASTATVSGLLSCATCLVSLTPGASFYSYGQIHNSSCTLVPAVSGISATAFSLGYATVTIRASGRAPIRIYGRLAAREASSGTGFFGFLEDGAFVSPYNNAKAMPGGSYQSQGSTIRTSVTPEAIIRAPSEGVHSYTLTARDLSGGAVVILNDTDSTSLFCVEEMK